MSDRLTVVVRIKAKAGMESRVKQELVQLLAALLLNLAVVAYLIYRLRPSRSAVPDLKRNPPG